MADLDDFFAKKDRKKNKNTKKFSTTDEVAKKLEDNAKKTEKQKKERAPEGDEANTPAHEQDEWRDFEEEKKDYTGLKIGNLTIGANEGNNAGATDSGSEQQQGSDEGNQEADRKIGPWKRIDVEVKESEKEVEAPAPQQQPQQPQQKSSAYVPPSLRGQQHTSQPLQPSRLRSKAAPDINNELYFPTLSKTGDFKKNRNEGSFETVSQSKSSSHRHAEQTRMSASQGPKLNLDNRYNTLSNDS